METSIPLLLDNIIKKAAAMRASDVHFEPKEDYLRVRYRVDGLLQEGKPVHKNQRAALISRIKVLVNLNIAETRLPQDGRTTIGKLDLRISSLPTLHGEKVVIRLLDRKKTVFALTDLGMEKDEFELYQKMIKRRCGIILVTGPTGSGKTTTLYATLSALNNKEVNITSIEDPIEYQLAGINQVQINPKAGLTFACGLRSILRQDPDIIMIGEIRDIETARIAVQAALTGHLVFSTLHTNDAPSAVTRLIDMGIEKYLIDASVIGVVAQRLVRLKAGNGFLGRTGIYELLSNGHRLRTLADNGQIKVSRDLTTMEEVARAVYLDV